MKTRLCAVLIAVAVLLLCITAIMPAAFAQQPLSIQINVQKTLEGTLPAEPETFIIRLTAEGENTPMPNGRYGGSCDLSITGAGSAVFPDITFDTVGIYSYTIEEIPGTNADCTYDTRTYRLTISILNGEEDSLYSEIALRENGKTEKKNVAVFNNVYKTVVPTTPPGTITPTGVTDRWMHYAGGAAGLLVITGIIVHFLRGKGDENIEEK